MILEDRTRLVNDELSHAEKQDLTEMDAASEVINNLFVRLNDKHDIFESSREVPMQIFRKEHMDVLNGYGPSKEMRSGFMMGYIDYDNTSEFFSRLLKNRDYVIDKKSPPDVYCSYLGFGVLASFESLDKVVLLDPFRFIEKYDTPRDSRLSEMYQFARLNESLVMDLSGDYEKIFHHFGMSPIKEGLPDRIKAYSNVLNEVRKMAKY